MSVEVWGTVQLVTVDETEVGSGLGIMGED